MHWGCSVKLLRTNKERLEVKDIQDFLELFEADYKPRYDTMWEYYQGRNKAILDRKATDPNNPDNKTPVPYGRKIITTFTGYAYRPGYITYKSDNENYLNLVTDIFDDNKEHIKTSRAGRNTGIFGVAYELLYLDNTTPKFATVDPREILLLYNYDIEPKKVCAIRYYPISKTDTELTFQVVVYYANNTEYYIMTKTAGRIDKLQLEKTEPNPIKEVQVIPYYFGDESLGLLAPVLPLIDDYDVLISDSMNEFDRFAHAYLRLVKMSLTPNAKSPKDQMRALKSLKRRRVFENLPEKDAVTFLTKDIPSEYIKYMTELIREQIHVQSHVPDLSKFSELSGIAVQRLMFDFENVVSSAEADFDTGLFERLRMISTIMSTRGLGSGDPADVTISHKRNAPLNVKEFADTAKVMKETGFSDYLVADVMPDDIIPDVEAELERQRKDAAAMMPSVEDLLDAERTTDI